ncbi:MAG: hypothetical protein QOG92_737, partial [Verrucomicrobiota bacterium]|nr:hypothetical protein [Verrucomicrobiota bacterium]
MEVMAEANEQPALLNQDVDDVKKPRRTKTAARPRRTTASKTGARRVKKQTKDEPIGSDTNNHLTLMESPDGAPEQKVENAPELPLSQPHGTVPAAEPSIDQKRPEMNEPVEEPVLVVPAPVRSQEAPPAVEASRYDPVFGEGLIEVSGKG